MIPLRDENPTRSAPVVVIALIIINVVLFLIDQAGGGRQGALAEFRLVPQNIINDLHGLPPVAPAVQPVWLTILTSMFMHANLLHIGGNMLYLWIFGNNVEDTVGHFRFLLFYLAGGFAAALAHIFSAAGHPQMAIIPTVGASGAIAAVLGAYLILYPSARVICLVVLGLFITTVAVPAGLVLVFWIFMQIASVSLIGGHGGSGGGVAYWAHIGGFAAGIVLIYLLGGKRLLRRDRRRYSDYYS